MLCCRREGAVGARARLTLGQLHVLYFQLQKQYILLVSEERPWLASASEGHA